MLYVTHAPFELARLAEHALLLDAGKVMASGALNEVITRPDLPLSHLEDAGALLVGQVIAHDAAYHLTLLRVGSSTLSISRRDLDMGQTTKLHVRARDVSLTLTRPVDTSISNILPARVRGIFEERDPGHRLVQLEVEGGLLLARITHFSLDQLRLSPGQHVFAQVKSVALVE
jgi:molybdate transport system ATP-binding protein